MAGIFGKSNAMVADGLHSASDISSVGVLIGNYVSATPQDKEHNYGHEKAETLVSFLLSLLLIFVSLTIGIEALKSLFNLRYSTNTNSVTTYSVRSIYINKRISI